MARTHHTTLYGTAQSMREKVSQSALTAGMRTRGMHGAGAWKKGGRSGQHNQGRDAQWTSRPAASGAHSRGGADLGHRHGSGAGGSRAAGPLEHVLTVEAVRRDTARTHALEQLRG